MNDRRRSRSPGPHRAEPASPRVQALRPTGEPPDIKTFREFPLDLKIQDAIEAMGITVPTPIQRLAIGPALEGKDLIAKAETGTGKTLAFGAPMMSKIDPSRSSVLGLVLCPTRELAQQVAGVLEKLGQARGIKVALVVGGEPIHPQINALKQGAQVVVGTPGRVIDLYGQRFLSFPWTEFAVLDEADQMLEIGFIDDVRKILSYTPDERQTMLFSATFPEAVLRLARESTRNPAEIATAQGVATVKSIDQSYMHVTRDDHSLALIRLIEQSEPDDVFLVFCDKRTSVDSLMRRLERMPFSVKALHGGYDQAARFRVMSAFRTGEVKALVATDVASRGLDVAHVSHVINYDVPQDVSDYTHRIGRTGRAGRTGIAITMVTPESSTRWRAIERTAPWKIRELEAPGRNRSGPRREFAREEGRDAPREFDRGRRGEQRPPPDDSRRAARAEPRRDPRDEPRRAPREESRLPRADEPRRAQREERGDAPRREHGRFAPQDATRTDAAPRAARDPRSTSEPRAVRREFSERDQPPRREPPRDDDRNARPERIGEGIEAPGDAPRPRRRRRGGRGRGGAGSGAPPRDSAPRD